MTKTETIGSTPQKGCFNFQIFETIATKKDQIQPETIVVGRSVKLVEIRWQDNRIIVDPSTNGTIIGSPLEVGRQLATSIPILTRTDLIKVFAGDPDPGQVVAGKDRFYELLPPSPQTVQSVVAALTQGRQEYKDRQDFNGPVYYQSIDLIT